MGNVRLSSWRRSAQIGQRPLAQQIGIALPASRKLDYSFGDNRNNRIGSVLKMQCRARQFERDAHDAFGLRIELMAVQIWEQEDNRLDQMNLWR